MAEVITDKRIVEAMGVADEITELAKTVMQVCRHRDANIVVTALQICIELLPSKDDE